MGFVFTASTGLGVGLLICALALMLWGNWRKKAGGGVWPLLVALPAALFGVLLALRVIAF